LRHRPLFVLALLALAARAAAGERIYAAAGDANPLQYLGAGARPAALGSAFTAVSGDLASLYFNPAGLGALKGSHAGLHHHSWLGGISQESLSFGLGGSLGSFGATGDWVNYGSIEGADEQGNPQPAFTPTDLTLGLNAAREFSSGLALGLRARATQQSVSGAGQLVMAGDVGALWSLPAVGSASYSLGLTYSNFGPAVDGSAPSAALRLGAAVLLSLGPEDSLLFLLSGSGLNNGGNLLQAGVELGMTRYLAARVGYQAAFLEQEYGGLSGLSAGLGLKFGAFTLDYAYLPYGSVGNSHRLSLNIDFFGGAKPAPAAVSKPRAAAALRPRPSPAPIPPRATAAPREPVDMVFEVPGAPSEEAGLKAAAETRGDFKSWYSLGGYYYRQKDRPQMLQAFEKALSLDPGNASLKKWLEKVKKGE
jgi:hypothetical protein